MKIYLSDIIDQTRPFVVVYAKSFHISFIDNDGKSIMRKFQYHPAGKNTYLTFKYKGHTIIAPYSDTSLDWKFYQL